MLGPCFCQVTTPVITGLRLKAHLEFLIGLTQRAIAHSALTLNSLKTTPVSKNVYAVESATDLTAALEFVSDQLRVTKQIGPMAQNAVALFGNRNNARGKTMNSAETHDQAQWYAVRTKLNEEDRANSNLRAWRVETFAPKVKELHTSDFGGSRYVTKHLFARYIFARFELETQLHNVNYTRGVQSVVSFGGSPISIDDKVIDLIKERVDDDGFVRVEDFKAGDTVRVNAGPLQSIEGVFERKLKDKDRVKILLSTMSYGSHLLIDRAMVEKVH